jgi:TatA/E family protein of Tat protein translocase
MFNLGPLELLAILVVALLVFGPDKLPEIGKQVGKAMKEFKQFQAHVHEQARDVIEPITGPIMSGNGPFSGSGSNGPAPTNISGGPIPTGNNVPRSATIQNPGSPEGEAAAAPPGTFGHYAPVEPPSTGTGEVLSGPPPAPPAAPAEPSPGEASPPAGSGETDGR